MRDGGDRPSFDRYVAGLPGGLDAYPDVRIKGSVVRSVVDGQPEEVLRELPAPVRALALDPPVDSEWIPEAYFAALLHAVAERRGYGPRECRAWFRRSNRALFASPLYRILFVVVSPEALLRQPGKRWGAFHRGTTLELEGVADDGVRLALRFPAGLFDEIVLDAFAEAFAAALEAAHAKDPVVEVEARAAGFARFLARW